MWTPDLDQEWLEMKKSIKEAVSLSPLNTDLPIHLHVDASKLNRIGYILTQPSTSDPKDGYNIIDIGSTCFTDTQKRYSPVETEALGVSWALEKVDYYVRAAEMVEIYTDCKSLLGLFAKDLADIKNSRLQRMLENTTAYNLNFNHVKGESHKVADCMSRNPLPGCEAPEYELGLPVIANRSRRALQDYSTTLNS